MEMLAAGSVELALVRCGASHDGPPLVLLHGFAGSSGDWAGVLPALAERREVLAYDHRGHGHSAHADDYTFDALTADLRAVLDALRLDRVDLLGHSMGGVVAQLFALAEPDRVRRLILMDTAPMPSPRSRLGTVLGAVVTAVVRSAGMRPLAALARGSTIGRMDPKAFLAFGKTLGDYPSLVPRLGTITCPTTVLVGENDHTLHAGAEALASGIPDAALVVVPGAGHSPQTDRPADWLAAVEGALR